MKTFKQFLIQQLYEQPNPSGPDPIFKNLPPIYDKDEYEKWVKLQKIKKGIIRPSKFARLRRLLGLSKMFPILMALDINQEAGGEMLYYSDFDHGPDWHWVEGEDGELYYEVPEPSLPEPPLPEPSLEVGPPLPPDYDSP